MVEEPDHGAFRYHDSHARGGLRYGSPGQVTGSHSHGQLDVRRRGFNVPARHHELPVVGNDKAPSLCASSLTVTGRLKSVTIRASPGWPASGSRMIFWESADTFSASPAVNRVPACLPSRPSRAMSTTSSMAGSRTSLLYSRRRDATISNTPFASRLRYFTFNTT